MVSMLEPVALLVWQCATAMHNDNNNNTTCCFRCPTSSTDPPSSVHTPTLQNIILHWDVLEHVPMHTPTLHRVCSISAPHCTTCKPGPLPVSIPNRTPPLIDAQAYHSSAHAMYMSVPNCTTCLFSLRLYAFLTQDARKGTTTCAPLSTASATGSTQYTCTWLGSTCTCTGTPSA